MPHFLSDAWVRELDERLQQRLPRPWPHTDLPRPVVVAFQVVGRDADDSGPADTEPGWHLVIDPDGARFATGVPSAATLTIYATAETAAALAANTVNAQRAIDAGLLTVRGDLNGLAALAPVLAALSTMPPTTADR